MHNDRFIYLLIKKQSGEITLEEQLELSELLGKDESTGLLAEGMSEVFDSSVTYEQGIKAGTVNKALEVLRNRIREDEPAKVAGKYRHLRYYRIAASFILLVGCGILYWSSINNSAERSENIVATKKGSKTSLVLPDGTKVWVNADSRLSYGKDFGNHVREVYLTGEAYFDVAEDKKKPFVVHTKSIDVKVLGTAFNVRAYGDEDNTQTTLLRGSIEVLLKKNKNKKLLLSPNEKMIVRNDGDDLSSKTTAASSLPDIELLKIDAHKMDTLSLETQWTQNKLVFEQERLMDIVPVLERWYNVSIELKNVNNSDVLYRGTFENDSLDDVLESLKMIGKFNYRIQKDKVVIY